MKPIKVIMNAFGPYSKTAEVNFEDFNLSGLYLITGETGAGKTTVFDAITFALFGSASGSVRNNTGNNSLHLRSDFAKENETSYVELTFLCRGEKYKIHRTTSMKKAKKRTDGFTIISETVELTKPDGSIITDKDDVADEIKNLLGIDKDQFSQIVMLAQGEFQKLLNSDTKDREAIFRHIFKTNDYKLFQDKLQERLKQSKENTAKLSDNLHLYIGQILCDEESDLHQLKTDPNNISNTEEIIRLLNQQNKEDKKSNDGFEKTINKLNTDIDNVSKQIGEAVQIEKNQKLLENYNKQKPALEKMLTTAKTELANAEKQKPEKVKADKIIANLEKELPKYAELKDTETILGQAETELKTCEAKLTEQEEAFTNAKKEYDINKKNSKNLAQTEVKIQKNSTELEKISQKLLTLKDLQQNHKDLILIKDEYGDALEIAQKSENEYIKANNDYDEKHIAYNRNIAGILAESLKSGDKCPVCGATKHPGPAKKTDENISEEIVKKAKKLADEKKETYNKDILAASELKTQCSEKEKQLVKEAKKIFKTIKLEDLPAKLETEIKTSQEKEQELKEKEKTLNADLAAYNNYQAKITEFEAKRETYESDIKQAETNKNNAAQKITEVKTKISEIKKSLQYPDFESANKELEKNKKISKDIENQISDAETNKVKAEKELAEIKGQIKSLKDALESKKVLDLDKLNDEFDKLSEQREDQTEQKDIIVSRYNTNNNLHDKIKTTFKQYEKARSEYGDIQLLSNTANGNLSGAQKISFEQYVQTAYFDRVIKAANERFRQISYNQYELVRKEDLTKKGQNSLDLNVMDYHTGKERSVKTLSGGESFKAALSLSLGLSDIVQNQSGGIQIDAMFIDEGFGSLDSESLEQALGVLVNLSDSDRLIGIISHVPTLKEKIEKQIVVSKTQTGSVLEVRLP